MNKLAFIGVLLVAVAAAFAVGRWTTGTGEAERAEAPDEPVAAEEEVLYWTCSMHPQVRQPEPGSCPICAMDLIPVTDEDDPEDADLPRLQVSERAAALMRVETSPVERRSAVGERRFLGNLEADETLLRDVVVRTESYVETLHADYQWRMVREGEPLAELYSPEVRSAARELLIERDRLAARPEAASAASAKLRRLGVSADQIERILETGEVPYTYEIRSPIEGHVMALEGREGTWLPEGRRLVQVMDRSQLWLQLEAYERDLDRLETGLPVELSFEAFPGEPFEGEVSFISPHIVPEKRTAQVRVVVPNPEHRLKPGMFARAIVPVSGNGDEPSLLIPKSAPLITGKRAVVYVQLPDRDRPTFEGRQVTLGPRAGDYYIVRDGLEEGELVVTRGNFKIDSELQIRGRPSMMAPGREDPEVPDDPDAVDYREPPEPAGFAGDVPASFGQELRPLFQGYLDMVAGLADDDYAAAREGLLVLHEALQEIGQHRMDGDAHVAWMEHYQVLHELSHHIENAEDLDGMREHLQEITRELEEVAVSFGAGQLPTLYRMYCPMAHDDEGGTWLQDHDTVDNAYFGEQMLRCGEALGTLGDE